MINASNKKAFLRRAGEKLQCQESVRYNRVGENERCPSHVPGEIRPLKCTFGV